VDFLQRYIGEVLEGVRRLYHDLSPGDLEDLGLTTALRNMVEDFMALHEQTTWRLELPNLEGLFPLAVQTIIYRVFQEALTNIGKHAEPSEVDITATCEGQQVGFVIADNGRGFNLEDLADPGKPSLGLGLMAMEERLKIAGGSLTIWSKPGEGVRLSFNIPAIRAGEQE
jgi:signal transduction histidine kinase